ncbi:hypothetical protein Fmac_015768 [Flemingia macrophylla]|uniref:Carboxylesterase n=1 Tax=Flemingia macrophylla TaxID=520843 RepID=A0ABD1MFI1_9FABA
MPLLSQKASLTDIKSETELEDNWNEYRGRRNSEKVCKSVKVISHMNSTMSRETVDPCEPLPFICNPDGTFTRLNHTFPCTEASSDPTLPIPVLSKDLIINQTNKTWLRLFLPRIALSSSTPKRLPLILYFHGSGFVLMSAATSMFHDFCLQIRGGQKIRI